MMTYKTAAFLLWAIEQGIFTVVEDADICTYMEACAVVRARGEK